MTSVSFTSKIAFRDAGTAARVHPAPARIAALQAMQAAPVRPVEPPTTSTEPDWNLFPPTPRRCSRPSTSGSIKPASGVGGRPSPVGGMPMSTTSTRPAYVFPGAIQSPSFGAWKVTVRSARTAGPLDLAGRGIEAGWNVDRDHGRPRCVDRLDRLVERRPRAAREAGAEQRVDHHGRTFERRRQLVHTDLASIDAVVVGARVGAQVRGGEQEQHVDAQPVLAQKPRDHQPVAAVVAAPANDPHGPIELERDDRPGDLGAGAFHQLQRRDSRALDRPAIERTHLVSRVDGLEPGARAHARKILRYSTVTVFARFRGWSTFNPRSSAMLYARSCRGITARIGCRIQSVRGMKMVWSAAAAT